MPEPSIDPLLICDALNCERPADWAYIGEGGDMYLCEFHGGPGDVEGWTRIVRNKADLDTAIARTVARVNRGEPPDA